MTRPREGPDARSMSPSEAAAKKIADNTIEILRAERDRLFNTVAQQAAEIERLRAFEMAARDLNNDLTRIAKERDEMATQIKKLKEDLEQAEICIRARLDVIDQQAARIAELEKWLKKERSARLLENSPGVRIAYLKENEIDFDKFFDGKALEQLQADGKISIGDHIVGPDQMVPSWQITEERVGLLEYCLESLLDAPDIEESTGPRHSIELIRAMLKEVE